MSNARTIVITNCTNRKRATAGKPISLRRFSLGTLKEVADSWRSRVEKASSKLAATEMYVGRSFNDAVTVAEELQGKLFVVSAGLGLLSATKRIPAYNLTVSGGHGAINVHLAKLGATIQDWWTAINRGRCDPVSRLVVQSKADLVLIALPANYLHMIAGDISAFPRRTISRLRIFTSPAGIAALPAELTNAVMPYDERLEGSPFAGTRNDFAQRAMRHFVSQLKAHTLDLTAARRKVQRALRHYKVPTIPARVRKSDDELIALLWKSWQRYDGNSTRLLRFLRDEALVSCEQSRFRGLWKSIGASKIPPH